jgi:adenylylsulfate kinase
MLSQMHESEGKGLTLWFTGLPCSGKSTVAQIVFQELRRREFRAELLDGDVVRENLTKDLGFSKKDRDENIRRIGFVCELLTRHGVIAIVAAISPYRAARQEVRKRVGTFVEVYVNCPLEICMRRDDKGMYARAVAGQLSNFTGVSDPYEEPSNPELVLYTDKESSQESARKVLEELSHRKYIPSEIAH